MTDITDQVSTDSPNNINMDETRYYKYLEKTDPYRTKMWPQCLRPFLESNYGFVKGRDVISSPCLNNLKWIWRFHRSQPRRTQ